MGTLDLEIGNDVLEFYQGALIGLGIEDPVATLIFGRFSDESEDSFRMAVSERSELSIGPDGAGAIYQVPKLGLLYVPNKLAAAVRGKSLSMQNDLVILSNRG